MYFVINKTFLSASASMIISWGVAARKPLAKEEPMQQTMTKKNKQRERKA